MASLNTLRTRFGVVLSIVIAFALLAFILSLKTEMGFSGNDPKVGVIDGEKIRYSEYLDQYDAVKAQNGGNEADEQQLQMLSDAAWQGLFSKHVLEPGFERMGLEVTPAERKSIISGEVPTQAMYAAFADRRTGAFDVQAVSEFLAQAETNEQAARMWGSLTEQARKERQVAKYLDLVRGGAYVNALETAQGVAAANNTYAGKWASKRYNTLPDSLFTVSTSEIKAYYKEHKDRYKQKPNRTISYVVFDVAATDDDMLAIERQVNEANEEFSVTEDLKGYVRKNRNASIGDRYLSPAQMTDEEAEALTAGRQYGPVLKNNIWTIARVADVKSVPDSIGVRHIALPYYQAEWADSLAARLRAGEEFAEVSEGAGEERVYPFSAFTEEFIPQLAGAKQGDVVTVQVGSGVHVMQVYRVDAPSKHYRIASVTYPVEASAATKREAHNKAGVFAVDAAGSVDKFNEAASAAAVTPRVATVAQGDREIRGLEKSHEIVRWMSDAKKGDISEIFNVGDDYVVAILTEIDDAKYTPVGKLTQQIRNALLRDKKYERIVSQLSGSTIEEAAASLGSEVESFENVRYASFYVNGMGIEPRVVGAIAATEQTGALSAPVKGNGGVYVFRVDEIADSEQQTPDAERVRLQATLETMVPQASFAAIQQMSDIEDLRAKYF